jgi:putative membrane protein
MVNLANFPAGSSQYSFLNQTDNELAQIVYLFDSYNWLEAHMMDLVLHFLLLGIVILMIARSLPGIHVDGYGTALGVAIVYGLINITLGTVFKVLSIPLIIVTLGVFLVIINTFLLWLTDELFEDFEIDDLGTTFVAALLITISDTTLDWIF